MTNTLNVTPAIPEISGTASTIVGDYIIFVQTDYDSDQPNPLEDMDGMGTIYSLNRRHNNFKPDKIAAICDPESEDYDPDHVRLAYYEHGRCMWMVANGSYPAGVEFRWDGTSFAGVWVPDDGLRGYADSAKEPKGSAARAKRMREYAQQACTLYTQWCNGDIYWYSVSAFKIRRDEDGNPFDDIHDYRRDKRVFDDSCGGIYDDDNDYFENQVKEAADAAVEAIVKISAS